MSKDDISVKMILGIAGITILIVSIVLFFSGCSTVKKNIKDTKEYKQGYDDGYNDMYKSFLDYLKRYKFVARKDK